METTIDQELPKLEPKVLISLLKTILSAEDKSKKFKLICDSKKDDETGELLFGESGSALRRGEWRCLNHCLLFLVKTISHRLFFAAVQLERYRWKRKSIKQVESQLLRLQRCDPPFSPSSPQFVVSPGGPSPFLLLPSLSRQSLVASPPPIMTDSIMWSLPLTPLGVAPLGIVCIVTPGARDQHNTLRTRITILIPLWDESDLELYEANLTDTGDGIILRMPSTAGFLRKLDFVSEIYEQMGINTQTSSYHVAFCNKLSQAKGGSLDTVKIRLLFPNGETYNNNSFNSVRTNDGLELQRKECLLYDDTENPDVPVAMRVAFEAALDQAEGLDANEHTQVVEDVTARLFRMRPLGTRRGTGGANSSSTPGGATGSGGMSF